MNAQLLTTLLTDPTHLHQVSVTELQDAANRYPYSAVLQSLLVKKYQLLGDSELDMSIARAALLHPNREQLLKWMEIPLTPTAPVHEGQKGVAIATNPIVDTFLEKVEAQQHSAIAVVVENELAPIEPVEEVMVVEQLIEPELVAPAPINMATDKLSFTDWLKRVKEGAVEDSQALDNMIGAAGYEAQLTIDAKETPIVQKTEATTDPTISPTVSFEQRVDEMAQRSVTMTDDLVTETLAKILEIQRKYSKAIDAYEKLILKHPDRQPQYQAAIDRLRLK